MKRRILSVFLALCMVVSLTSALSTTAMAASTYATDLAQTAEKQVNKSYSQLSLPSTNWCVRFVGYCINTSSVKTLAGGTISKSYAANPMTLANWLCSVKKIGTYYSLSSTHTNRLQETYKGINLVSVSESSFSPNEGDIVIFDWNKREDSARRFSHAGIVTKVSGSKITYVDGNSGSDGANYKYVKSHEKGITNKWIIGYIRINGDAPSITTGSWTVTIPANYKVLCYASADAVTSCDYRKARTSKNTITCTKKATFTDGTVRYMYTTTDSKGTRNLWFDFTNKMSVQETKSTSTDTSSGSTSSAKTIKDGNYYIATALNTNYVLDLTGGSSSNGANIQLYRNDFVTNQIFTVKYLSDGYYEIISTKSGKVLDVASAGKKNGTNVQQYTRNNSDAQQWIIQDAGNGYYTVVSKCNGLCLDVSGAKVANKTNIQMYTKNGTNAQKWKFIEASTLKINLTGSPTSIKKGSYYDLTGTVSSNYDLKQVQGTVTDAKGKTVLSSTDKLSSGKKSMDIKSAHLNKDLLFNKLPKGSYTLKVTAIDALGKTETCSKTFQVT